MEKLTKTETKLQMLEDKIISYRVIESGIVYDYDEKDAKMGEVEREARTILEVRLTDAKTSEILSAITLDGKANDFVKEGDVSALKSFSYRYYSHTFPKTHGNSTKVTVKSTKVNPWPFVGGLVGLTWMLNYWATLIPVWLYFIVYTFSSN